MFLSHFYPPRMGVFACQSTIRDRNVATIFSSELYERLPCTVNGYSSWHIYAQPHALVFMPCLCGSGSAPRSHSGRRRFPAVLCRIFMQDCNIWTLGSRFCKIRSDRSLCKDQTSVKTMAPEQTKALRGLANQIR